MFHVIYEDPGKEDEYALFDQHETWATAMKGILAYGSTFYARYRDRCWYQQRSFSLVFFLAFAERFEKRKAQSYIAPQALHRAGALRGSGWSAPVR